MPADDFPAQTRILVTGASGSIGRQALRALAGRRAALHAVARRAVQPVDKAGVRWHAADLLDEAAVGDLVARVRPTHLLHLAWVTTHGVYWNASENWLWLERSRHLVEAFVRHGGMRVVVAGTCAEYDWDAPELAEADCVEAVSREATRTAYAASKLELLRWLSARNDVSSASGRIFYAYGEGENESRLIPSIIRALLTGRKLDLGPGGQIRDFLDVRDVGTAFAALLGSNAGKAVNLSSGVGVPLVEVASLLSHALALENRQKSLIRFGAVPIRSGEPWRLVGSATRLRSELGFRPRYGLAEGLTHTARWWQWRLGGGGGDGPEEAKPLD